MTYDVRWGILATGFIARLFTSDLLLAGHKVSAVGSRSQQTANRFAAFSTLLMPSCFIHARTSARYPLRLSACGAKVVCDADVRKDTRYLKPSFIQWLTRP